MKAGPVRWWSVVVFLLILGCEEGRKDYHVFPEPVANLVAPHLYMQSNRQIRLVQTMRARIFDAIAPEPGMWVADIGTGDGSLTLSIARRVGPEGRVYATDIDAPTIERLRSRLRKEGLLNVTPVWVDTRNGNQDTYGGYRTVTGAPDDRVATTVRLRIGPNPAGDLTGLRYVVPVDGAVSLELYDLKGRRVRTLVDRMLRRGTYRFDWDTTDQAGRRVPAGTYLARLRTAAGGETQTVTVHR